MNEISLNTRVRLMVKGRTNHAMISDYAWAILDSYYETGMDITPYEDFLIMAKYCLLSDSDYWRCVEEYFDDNYDDYDDDDYDPTYDEDWDDEWLYDAEDNIDID